METTPHKSAAGAAAVLAPRAPSPEAKDALTMKAVASNPTSTSPLRRIFTALGDPRAGVVRLSSAASSIGLDERNATGWAHRAACARARHRRGFGGNRREGRWARTAEALRGYHRGRRGLRAGGNGAEASADFSSASSDFKALGAFFCNFVTPKRW